MKDIKEIFPGCRWEATKVYQKMCSHADYKNCNEHWVVREALNGFRPNEEKAFVTSVLEDIPAKPCILPV